VLANKDLVSKPAAGRFFPVSIAEALRMFKMLRLQTPYLRRRPDVVMVNSRGPREHGQPVAALYPAESVVLYSFPQALQPQFAKQVTECALRTLAEIGCAHHQDQSRFETFSFRAYLAESERLVITARSRKIKRAKYRGRDKFTHSCKPKAVKTDERVLRSVEVT